MPETLTFPPEGTYRVTPVDATGRQNRGLGRRLVTFDGATVAVHERRRNGAVIMSFEATAVERVSNKQWTITTESGETVRLQSGCGCGGG